MGNVCKSNRDTSKPTEDLNGTTAADSNLTANKYIDKQTKNEADIFVSLREGSIFDVYEEGPVLGKSTPEQFCCRVTHRQAGVVRIMKTIDKKSVIGEEAEKRFTEARILKDLDHPNILKLFELYQSKEKFYLITEYLSGESLFDRIKPLGSFKETQAAEYMKQILSAVAYCHSKNIVHRNLNLDSLFLTSIEKSDATLKVINFGFSTKFEQGHKMTKLIGSLHYHFMAPEILLSKYYDQKCDVWSCGVILYFMLCGHSPFNGKNTEEILAKVKKGEISFNAMKGYGISEEAKSFINKMLTFDPANRISAAAALKDTWIQKNTHPEPLDQKLLENLSKFSSKSKLKRAILTCIVTQISTEQEKEKLQKTFASLDKDSSGILTTYKLTEGFMLINGGLRSKAEDEAKKIIAEIDTNGSEKISFSEFMMAAMDRDMLLLDAKVEMAFRLFDQNGDGFITREEFVAVMGGIEFRDDEWVGLLQEVDADKDEKISKKAFVALLQKMAQKEKA